MMRSPANGFRASWRNLHALISTSHSEDKAPKLCKSFFYDREHDSDWESRSADPHNDATYESEQTPEAVHAGSFNEVNDIQAIGHIVFMAQTGRSFDHLYGKLNEYRRTNDLSTDVDDLPPDASNPDAGGEEQLAAFHISSACAGSPDSSWRSNHLAFNRNAPSSEFAAMDGFVYAAEEGFEAKRFRSSSPPCVLGYLDAEDLPYYYFMASNFATSDRWFSPVMSGTEANRMYLIAATSQGHVYPVPSHGPPLTAKTIFQLLQENGISWKIYVSDQVPGRSLLESSYFGMFSYGNEHQENVVPISQYFEDVASGTLPRVAMIEGGYNTGRDENASHSRNVESAQAGSRYVATLINALMSSRSWTDTVFIETQDQSGGFYDHVPPQLATQPDGIAPQDLASNDPPGDFTRTGYRVPLLVISPFTKKHYVSHTIADFTAILKFIESRFNLPALTERDAAQMDMTEFFDFKNVPWASPPNPPASSGVHATRTTPELSVSSNQLNEIIGIQPTTIDYMRRRRLGGESIRFAREFEGQDFCAKINAAIVDGPPTGVTVNTIGLDGVQSCASDPFTGVTKPVLLILGDVYITTVVGWTWPSNVRISGVGDASTIAFAPNDQIDNLLIAYGVTNLELDHVKITGTANTARLVSINRSSHVKIHDNSITGAGYIPKGGPLGGVVINDASTDVWVERNVFSRNGPASPSTSTNADIVNWVGSNRGVHIRGNQISGGTATIPIAMFDCIDCDVIGNQVDQNNKTSGNNKDGYGILSYGTGNHRPKRIRIIGNKVSNTAGSGIYLAQNDGAIVRDNKISNSSQQQSDITLP
ncbi:MAG: Phospholipase, partial [Acidobacteriaceae bacterium]|nr:Phospholipase [Acidobacteriaceae bacterium]